MEGTRGRPRAAARRSCAAAAFWLACSCGPPPEVVGPQGWQARAGEECGDLRREEDRVLCEAARRHPEDDGGPRSQAGLVAGDPAATVAAQLERFRSYDPGERAGAIENLSLIASFEDTSAATILEAALVAGEDPAARVRDAAARLQPPPPAAEDRPGLMRVVAAHLLRGECVPEAPAELAQLDVARLVQSRVRRQTLAAAALLAVAIAGPGEEDDGPGGAWGALDAPAASDDPETRMATLAAIRRGAMEAATVMSTPDPNPVVDAILRGQGDRLRVSLTLGGGSIEPGGWEALLPPAARAALREPLWAALAEAFDRIAAWRIPGGDQTSGRARLVRSWDELFLRGLDDSPRAAGDAASIAAAARTLDFTLGMEMRAEIAIDCLRRAGLPGAPERFPRSLAEFGVLARSAAGTRCQDDELILLVDDAGRACAEVGGAAADVVADVCGAPGP